MSYRECPEAKCQEGWIIKVGSSGHRKCKTCGGTGLISNATQSVTAVKLRELGEWLESLLHLQKAALVRQAALELDQYHQPTETEREQGNAETE